MSRIDRRLLFGLITGGCVLAAVGIGRGAAGFETGLAWTGLAIVQACAVLLMLPPQTTKTGPKHDDALRRRIIEELNEQAHRLDEREQVLAGRLVALEAWLDFPEPIDLTYGADLRAGDRDREVLRLIETETHRVYDAILNRDYEVDGRVDIELVRNDARSLMRRVARIYAPDSDNPLLETSFEQLARAASRICLHVLVVMDKLPLDVKQYNIGTMYDYMRRAIATYGAWKTAEPYIGYLSRSLYFGRYLAGANPVTLGAWWAATELGSRGAKKVVSSYVNRQAVAFLHDVVRVISFEVAAIYGGSFRHRDANWVLGSELVELVSRFPPSHECLAEAMRVIAALQVRNEYDRVHLFRCLAERRGCRHRAEDYSFLTREEREQIARRLEGFLADAIHGKTAELIAQWALEFERRFDMKPNLAGTGTATSGAQDASAAYRSLAAFLTAVRGRSASEVQERLRGCRVAGRLDAAAIKRISDEIEAAPAVHFEPPGIEPASPVMTEFIGDLMEVALQSGRYDDQLDELLISLGAYLRFESSGIRERIDSLLIDRIRTGYTSTVPRDDLTGPAVRTMLGVIDDDESIAFVFADARPVITKGNQPDDSTSEYRLLGTRSDETDEKRLLLIRVDEQQSQLPEGPVWIGVHNIVARRIRRVFADDCELSGGTWSAPQTPPETRILIAGSISAGGFDRYFAPLLDRCRPEA